MKKGSKRIIQQRAVYYYVLNEQINSITDEVQAIHFSSDAELLEKFSLFHVVTFKDISLMSTHMEMELETETTYL